MRKTSMLLLVVFSAAAVAFVLVRKAKQTDPKKAQLAETAGDYQSALLLYTEALLQMTPMMKAPDINRSKFVAPDIWRKEVGKYCDWILGSSQSSDNARFRTIIAGIERCRSKTESDNRLQSAAAHEPLLARYQTEWNRAFFAPTAKIDPEHLQIASSCFDRNISIIKLASLKSYSYDISLIDTSSLKRSECLLYPESATFFLASPGPKLLICRSSVKFPSGEQWLSSYTVIPLEIPEKPSIIDVEVRTRVSRGGE